ncbi:MAG: PCRF domain-containing protein [Candidatus Paceibacterota bacterium]
MDNQETQKKIDELESQMNQTDFWADKNRAQSIIKEIQELKDRLEGFAKYDKKSAVLNIFAGAGGDDAEDFVRILYEMYSKFFEKNNFSEKIVHEHKAQSGGYRNISVEVKGKNVYGILKKESGVHRLVRISPFNANAKRHTSFAMVEFLPLVEDKDDFSIPKEDLEVSFARSSGPGGQNVNKRDTAVRLTHIPTGISVHVESERTQEANREKAEGMIKGKIIKILEEQKKETIGELSISKTTENEWGSQIRSYVFQPYQMIKDHRTGVEIRDLDKVLKSGEIEEFINAERLI